MLSLRSMAPIVGAAILAFAASWQIVFGTFGTGVKGWFDAKVTDYLVAAFTFVLMWLAYRQDQNLRAVQRAFVTMDHFDYRFHDNVLLLAPCWINGGSTQTKRAHIWTSWKTFPGELPEDFDFPDLDADGNVVQGRGVGVSVYLGPKASLIGEYFALNAELLEQIRNRELRAFIWGRAYYFDAFEGTPQRRTTFCNEIVMSHFVRHQNGQIEASITYPSYRRGNGADEDAVP